MIFVLNSCSTKHNPSAKKNDASIGPSVVLKEINTSVDDFPFVIDAEIDSVISITSEKVPASVKGRVVYQVFIKPDGKIKGINILALDLYDSSGETFVEYLKYQGDYKAINEYPDKIQDIYYPIVKYLDKKINVNIVDNIKVDSNVLYYFTAMRKIAVN